MTTRLVISLLGPLQVTLEDEAVTQFGSDTARALLAYLALHPGVPHRRDALAGLLWPEHTDAQARRNLRVALSRLRAAIGDREADAPLLQVAQQTIQFPEDGRCSVDVGALRRTLAATRSHAHDRLDRCDACVERLQAGTALYRGEFLAGFSVGSAPFEEWMVVEREGLHWQVLEALAALAAYHESQGEYEAAIECARRQVELEPWREEAHRQWMRALALTGHRGAALAQYDACRRILAEELGVEPEPETQALHERIRSGALAPAPPLVEAPAQRELPAAAAQPGPEPPAQIKPPTLAAPPSEVPIPARPGRAPEQPEGERRVVTALSVGLVGSAAAEEDLDPELWAEVVGQALGQALAVVDRYGGEVSQLREDGLVALFGAALTHEDDAERAVLAALAIRQAIQGGTPNGAGRARMDLRVRAGVHTGEAVVPRLGDGDQQHRVIALGSLVPVADQIARAAEPGRILVDEGTYRLARPFFEWEARDETALQRDGAAAALYHPLARAPQADALRGKGRGIAGLESPLVGREAEVDALQRALENLRVDIGGIVTVIGDAGIGKSRLVAEIRTSANLKSLDLKWIEGRCLSYTETEAYRLWGDVLCGLLGVATDAPATTVRDTLRERVAMLCGEGAHDVHPFLARTMALPLEETDEARLRGLNAEGLQVLTFRAWETLLECAVGQRPLVLVCEDLHWADPTSLALLEYLLPLTERVPLLLVCVFRPLTDHGCWQVRELAAREFRHRHTDLWLDALSVQESVELVGYLLRIEDLPDALRARILEHAEGNPFYVEELLRSLIDAGVLVYDEVTGRWHAVREPNELPLPDTLRGVLMARIDRLPGSARRVLQLASVVGRIFQRRVLESLVQSTGELDADLRTLQRAQMIRQRAQLPQQTQLPEAAYIFKHQLTQEAAYESLLRRKRRELHRRVAQALERRYPERVEEQLGLLAHHWERTGDVERAAHYLRRAGEQAAAQFANAEAAAYLSRTLDLTPQDDHRGRYALLLTREEVHNVQGAREAQAQDLDALEDLVDRAPALGDQERAAVAVRRAHHAVMIADYAAATAAAQLAVRLGRAANDLQSEASGHRHWGRALRRRKRLAEAQAHFERALILARSAHLRREEAYNLRQLGNVCLERGEYNAARANHEQALLLFCQIGDRRGEGMSLRDIAWALTPQGEYGQALHYAEQSLRICRETGDRRDEGWALFALGHHYRLQGNLASAADHYERSLPLLHETDPMGEGAASLYAGIARTQLGSYARAQDNLERSLHITRAIAPDEVAIPLIGLALVSHYLGRDEDALKYSRQVQQLMRAPEKRFPEVLIFLGHVLACLGHPAEAADAYRQATAILQRDYVGFDQLPELAAGKARVYLAQADLASALACVEEILARVETNPTLSRTIEPFQIYLTCYRVLRANEDPRADPVLRAAYRLLQEQAQQIDDPGLRRTFLEDVPAHREIAALHKQGLELNLRSEPTEPLQG